MLRLLMKEDRSLKQQGATNGDLDDFMDELMGEAQEWEGEREFTPLDGPEAQAILMCSLIT